MEMERILPVPERRKFRRLKQGVSMIILVLTLLVLWVGLDFLKGSVFKHYFDPARHVVVEEDPVTGEVYAWKDVLGNVYTQDDLQVKLFPYGATCLILIIGGIALGAYQVLCQHLLMILLLQSKLYRVYYDQTRRMATR